MTYHFNKVQDSVGKKVLEAIQSMMPKGRSVEDFGTGHYGRMLLTKTGGKNFPKKNEPNIEKIGAWNEKEMHQMWRN